MIRGLAPLVFLLGLGGCDGVALVGEPVGDLVVTEAPGGLLLQTEADYPCANHELVVDVDVARDRVTVEVEGVGEADVCQRAFGPASVVVPYPASAHEGANPAYDLVLRKDGVTDRYRSFCGFAGCSFGPVDPPTFSRPGPR